MLRSDRLFFGLGWIAPLARLFRLLLGFFFFFKVSFAVYMEGWVGGYCNISFGLWFYGLYDIYVKNGMILILWCCTLMMRLLPAFNWSLCCDEFV